LVALNPKRTKQIKSNSNMVQVHPETRYVTRNNNIAKRKCNSLCLENGERSERLHCSRRPCALGPIASLFGGTRRHRCKSSLQNLQLYPHFLPWTAVLPPPSLCLPIPLHLRAHSLYLQKRNSKQTNKRTNHNAQRPQTSNTHRRLDCVANEFSSLFLRRKKNSSKKHTKKTYGHKTYAC
jgi:hypothetical protein